MNAIKWSQWSKTIYHIKALDILEKGLAPGKHLTKQRVLVITPLQHRMEQKGQQVEAQ